MRAGDGGRSDALGTGEAQVGLRGRLGARVERAADARGLRADGVAGLGQQCADVAFGRVVVALAEVRLANLAGGVDEVLGGPVLVAVGVPGRQFVVLDDGVADVVGRDRRRDVGRAVLERELR